MSGIKHKTEKIIHWNGHEVRLIRSGRKTMALEINKDLEILVRAPWLMPEYQVLSFLRDRSDWLEDKLLVQEKRRIEQERRRAAGPGPLTRADIQNLAEQALQVLPERTSYFAGLLGVSYGRITIRNQKTRWGSCSAKGNLNFNCLLMLTPPEIQDYVVVHELCHRLEMNHSPRFWNHVANILPDYKERRAWLKKYGSGIISRMTGRCIYHSDTANNKTPSSYTQKQGPVIITLKNIENIKIWKI